LASKLKLKAQQIDALSESVIQVTPSQKGSLHDGILKLKSDLLNVVIKVNLFPENLTDLLLYYSTLNEKMAWPWPWRGVTGVIRWPYVAMPWLIVDDFGHTNKIFINKI
jgi:hypothetical protein